ncbi:sensor histidine kinase [Serratia symbiotica]|uniref:Sensor histidine kinase DcuS n=1 Tax=Serratia symbiotica TaxID=138074 RepID=A0A068Z336_9GAMM|nr:sensor histidine kinase [Serratia symbiotica]MBF1995407.1 two-component system sensor histidine kinase DcuS [Serratia symbiotica]MBQ0956404.1 sensor histidine kinase [Serratia symbiotica]QLH62712.1 two-component system sensor histidine kinase DcuS [Serratia symbiotica]QTP15552.1 sensor histidine kinase [Serratia symbiotica]CDS58151.1 sensory histidine kinase in two-component regulatory system with DcuR, regulator of anaerobic fumarate respiration [Serratia symbiotica]
MPKPCTPLKLSTSITLMVSAIIISVLLVVYVLFFVQMNAEEQNQLRQKAMAIADTLALSSTVVDGLEQKDHSGAIQRFAEQVRHKNELLFVVVADMKGIRYSHPNPWLIGQHFISEDLEPVLHGKINSATHHGILAPALRVLVPVYNAQQQQIGVVALGIALDTVYQVMSESRWIIYWTITFAALIGSLGTFFLVSRLKRIMFGFEPYEIANLFEQRDAMLQSIKEGVIAVDNQSHITIVNSEAKRLLQLSGSAEDLVLDCASQHWLAQLHLEEVLTSGKPQRDRQISLHGSELLANTVAVTVNSQVIGAIATFRDKTEVSRLIQRLNGMAHYADALRVQSHEFMNKLHVILGMLHMRAYQQLENYIINTASNYQEEIGALLRKIHSPEVAGFIISKIRRAHEAGIKLTLDETSLLPETDDVETTHVLISVLGNLIENALDAINGVEGHEINLSFHHYDNHLHCTVSDDGSGIDPAIAARIFEQGFSTKGTERGIGLALISGHLEKLGGNIDFESEPGVLTQFFVLIPYQAKS